MTTFAMVLVGLLAMAYGVVNAGLLQVPDAHPHAARIEHPEPSHGAGLTGPAAVAADNDHDSRNSKAACLKLCDDGSRALVKQSAGINHDDPGPPPLAAILWGHAAAVVSDLSGQGKLWLAPDGLPFRVRFPSPISESIFRD